MEKTSILTELHYLPSITFFSQLVDFETIILEANENYQKGSYRNRCHIVGANGLMRLSIPLEKGKHQQTTIKDVKINYSENWHLQHWQSIKSAYGRSPFWEFYADKFLNIYEKKHEYLFDLNLEFFQLCCNLLKTKKEIQLTSFFEKTILEESISDKRYTILPNLDFSTKKYPQLFEERHGFVPNLSIVDALFCCGNNALKR